MTLIFGWAADTEGCGFYRVGKPLAELARRGHRTHSAIAPPTWYRNADTILGQRIAGPDRAAAWQSLAAAGNVRLVADLDDDYWSGAGAKLSMRPDPKTAACRTAVLPRVRASVAVAHLVTVTTPTLASIVEKINPNVLVVPNAVPGWLLTHDRPRTRRLTVGWAGSDSHRQDWDHAAVPLRRYFAANDDVDLHIIGVDFAQWIGLPADRYRHTPWVQGVENYYRKIDFDIGIAPLRPHRWNESRSPIKAIEYGALGIPIVASAVGPYLDYVRHGETGFLVRQPGDWSRHLRALVADPAMRLEMGAAAKRVAASHTVEQTAPLWEAALSAPHRARRPEIERTGRA